MDHASGSPSKYMTTIYNYFCMKMLFLDFLKVKKNMKICSKTHQIAPLKKIVLGGKHAPGPGTPVAKISKLMGEQHYKRVSEKIHVCL